MRKGVILFLLSFFLIAPIYGQEKESGQQEWDFGKVKQGEILKHDFIFKNQAKDTLNITGINTSCGCTASQADKRFLRPGEETAIKVSFNSHGYLGPVKQFVYVNTDSADMAIIKFVIKAEVAKE